MLVYLQMIEEPRHKSKFEEIYNAYNHLMYRTAYKYLRNEHDAEDAVHHTFVKIAENIKNIPPPCPKSPPFVVLIIRDTRKGVFLCFNGSKADVNKSFSKKSFRHF